MVNAADALTTWMGLRLGLAELNPVFLGLATIVGVVPALLLKLVGAAMIGLGLLQWRPRVLRFLVAGFALLVTWNVVALQSAL
jgi:hypothetical protein